MEESFELYKHIYRDSNMSCYTIEKLLESIKNKDNKIKDSAEDILKGYSKFKEEAKNQLEINNQELEESKTMSKMMASIGIKKEVINDNSDSSMADLLIQGISMGSLDTEKKLKEYEDKYDEEQVEFAKDFLEFQQSAIEKLKEYL